MLRCSCKSLHTKRTSDVQDCVYWFVHITHCGSLRFLSVLALCFVALARCLTGRSVSHRNITSQISVRPLNARCSSLIVRNNTVLCIESELIDLTSTRRRYRINLQVVIAARIPRCICRGMARKRQYRTVLYLLASVTVQYSKVLNSAPVCYQSCTMTMMVFLSLLVCAASSTHLNNNATFGAYLCQDLQSSLVSDQCCIRFFHFTLVLLFEFPVKLYLWKIFNDNPCLNCRVQYSTCTVQ